MPRLWRATSVVVTGVHRDRLPSSAAMIAGRQHRLVRAAPAISSMPPRNRGLGCAWRSANRPLGCCPRSAAVMHLGEARARPVACPSGASMRCLAQTGCTRSSRSRCRRATGPSPGVSGASVGVVRARSVSTASRLRLRRLSGSDRACAGIAGVERLRRARLRARRCRTALVPIVRRQNQLTLSRLSRPLRPAASPAWITQRGVQSTAPIRMRQRLVAFARCVASLLLVS